jgi:hypothetical protein
VRVFLIYYDRTAAFYWNNIGFLRTVDTKEFLFLKTDLDEVECGIV